MIKALMRETGMNIWQAAEKLGTDYMSLVDITVGKQEPDVDLKTKITAMMIQNGLCPDCGAHYVPQGGCKFCLCGWEMC